MLNVCPFNLCLALFSFHPQAYLGVLMAAVIIVKCTTQLI